MALFHEQPVELPSVNICAQLLGGGGGALRAEIYCLIKCMIVYGSCDLASPHDTNCQKRELESPVSPTWKPTTGSQEDPPRVTPQGLPLPEHKTLKTAYASARDLAP